MPRTRITVKYVKNLTPTEYAQCHRLNFGNQGRMREELELSFEMKDSARTVLIKDHEGKVMSWSLVFPQEDGKDGVSAFFYVPKCRRRQGLGTRMLRQIKKIDPKPFIYPHDNTSGKFFGANRDSLRWASYDDYYMNR